MDEIELVKSKINIVDLIQEYLPLKKAGVNFKANCPFHQEKTPSFMVSPERQIWHCFGGCDDGGDIFKFLMKKEGIEFKEALEILAQKAGVVLKKGERGRGQGERLFEINLKAQQFFHYLLTEHKLGSKAFEYLRKRGLSLETIKQFNLGYAPSSWDSLTKFLQKRGYTTQEMILSGLCVASRRGCYDRFRGRIIFPLVDVRGRVIGFSGRVLASEESPEADLAVGGPKYINTPQTAIFDKGKFLLGLDLTKGEIKEKNEAIIVEGELDLLMSYQAGVKNIASPKGTALTEDQVELIRRYTETISLCFDTDLAGDQAARRGIEIADKAGLNIKVIQVKGAKDPAETILADPKLWQKAALEATPIYDYYLQSVSLRFDSKTAAGKRSIFNELLPIWKKISDPIQKDHYIQKLAALLQVKEGLINKHLDSFNLENKAARVAQTAKKESPKDDEQGSLTSKSPKNRRELLEEYLLALILHLPEDHTYIPTFPETLFTQERLRQVYVLLVLFLDSISFKGKSFKISEFVKHMPDELLELVDRLYLMQIDDKLSDKFLWQKEIESVVAVLKKMLIKTSLEKLSLQIRQAQAFDNLDNLMTLNRRFRDLSVKLKNL